MIKQLISTEIDVAHITMSTTHLAKELNFSETETCMIATTTSELGNNILKYANTGIIQVEQCEAGSKKGIKIRAIDNGPGIENIEQAIQDKFSTSGTLGIGLPGIKRMMDEFNIHSSPNNGTSIEVIKWQRNIQ